MEKYLKQKYREKNKKILLPLGSTLGAKGQTRNALPLD